MRILWISDALTAVSAYAGQSRLFIPRIRQAGHEVALLPMGGSAGSTYTTSDGMKVYPTWVDSRGNDVVVKHAFDFKADIVLTLGDPHVFMPESFGQYPWCAWAPLDFETPTHATWRSLSKARWIWAPSRASVDAYTAAALGKNAFHPSQSLRYMPHGIDSKIFDVGNRVESRNRFSECVDANLSGVFLIVAVAANTSTPSRKGFFELFSAFKIFSDHHRDARLYVHTDVDGIHGGERLKEILYMLKIDPLLVLFPSQYDYLCGTISSSDLADVYRAADVYLSTSHGEGAGLGSLESQMCGTPVVVSRNTAQTEYCLTGHAVRTEPYMPFDGATIWRRPHVSAVVEALESVYDRRHETPNREAIRDRVMRYDVDQVFERDMLPALKEIENEINV